MLAAAPAVAAPPFSQLATAQPVVLVQGPVPTSYDAKSGLYFVPVRFHRPGAEMCPAAVAGSGGSGASASSRSHGDGNCSGRGVPRALAPFRVVRKGCRAAVIASATGDLAQLPLASQRPFRTLVVVPRSHADGTFERLC